VVVLDLVDDENKVPILGQYMSNRVVESMTRNKTFRVAQRGEVEDMLNQLDLKPSFKYTSDEIQRLGKAMNAQALVMGKLTAGHRREHRRAHRVGRHRQRRSHRVRRRKIPTHTLRR
jgi:hypothetical protein